MKKVFLLLLSISLFSCNSDSDSGSGTPTNAEAYFQADLNGTALNYHQDNYTNPTHYASFGNGFQANGFDRYYYYGSDMMPITNTGMYPQIGLTFENLFDTSTTSSTETEIFYSLFDTTPTNFITNDQNYAKVKGISVSYQAPDGKSYSTQFGSQSGSVMTVTSTTDGIEYGGSLQIETVVGTVNCKLYNVDNPSDVITLTNGKFKLIFREDY